MDRKPGAPGRTSAKARRTALQLEQIVARGRAKRTMAENARKARAMSNQRRDDSARRNYRRGKAQGR